MSDIQLSVLIPAYQEAENLRRILPQLITVLEKMNINYEVLVVDTQEAMDETKEICAKNGVRYINRTGGNDYGCAIITGIQRATGWFGIFMDADGSHSPDFVEKLYENRDRGDVIIASRYVSGGNTENPPILIFMSRIVNIIYAFVLGLNCRDVSNSFKLYRLGDLKQLSLYSHNFDIVEEMLYKLKKMKGQISIIEIPFTFKERQYGRTKRNLLAFIASYIKTLVRLRFGK